MAVTSGAEGGRRDRLQTGATTQPSTGSASSGGAQPPPNPFGGDGPEPSAEGIGSPDLDFDWRVKFRSDVTSSVEKWAEILQLPKFTLDAFVRDNIEGAVSYILKQQLGRVQGGGADNNGRTGPDGKTTPEEYTDMWNDGLHFFSLRLGFDITQEVPKAGGSGSGRGGPSAGEIRAMFDEDELTDNVSKLWGAYLVEDAPDARAIAKEYINRIVATHGEQDIDFGTFVLGKIRDTNRHKLVYRGKPEGMDELQYIQPYSQAAQAVVGGGGTTGNTANDIAAGGAALGASADAFRGRLERTPEHQRTKGFINSIEERVRGVKDVLRG